MDNRKDNLKSNSEKGDVDMPTLIREIIEQEEAPYKEYNEYQARKLEYLRSFDSLPKEEQDELRSSIILELQDMGLIDSDGNLTPPYRRGEEE